MSNYKVTVLGAGLAGCEAALWLAGKGVQVELYEQKPTHFSPAHKSEGFAELICSNSLKAERLDSASGLLKEEMRRMGSQLLNAAEVARVAAGGALAVDRDTFKFPWIPTTQVFAPFCVIICFSWIGLTPFFG